jgi:hypothetical protein
MNKRRKREIVIAASILIGIVLVMALIGIATS